MKYPGFFLFGLCLYLVAGPGTRIGGSCEAVSVSVKASPLDVSDSEWTILTAFVSFFYNNVLECPPIVGSDANGCLSDLATNLTLNYSDFAKTVRTVKTGLSGCFSTGLDACGELDPILKDDLQTGFNLGLDLYECVSHLDLDEVRRCSFKFVASMQLKLLSLYI